MPNNAPIHDTVCIFFGPPKEPAQDDGAFSRFFAEKGLHVVCGGTTARLAAAFLGTQVKASLSFPPDGLPPLGSIEGTDLVTEGILTMNRVLVLLSDVTAPDPDLDGGADKLYALLCRAKKVHFYIGLAENPSHQDKSLSIPCRDKEILVKEITYRLSGLGIETEISVF